MSTQGENLPFVDLNMIREYIYAEVVYRVAILLRAIGTSVLILHISMGIKPTNVKC